VTINLLKGMGKAYQAWKRNKASKKLFKDASGGMLGKRNKESKKLFKDASGGMQYPVIKSVKPKIDKQKK